MRNNLVSESIDVLKEIHQQVRERMEQDGISPDRHADKFIDNVGHAVQIYCARKIAAEILHASE